MFLRQQEADAEADSLLLASNYRSYCVRSLFPPLSSHADVRREKKNTKLKQTAALKASVVLAFPARKKLVHHAPRIYAVLQAEAFVCVLPRNQFDSTHTVYIRKCQGFFLFLKP